MAREFKPVRLFVMMAVAAFIVCSVMAFYTHRAEQDRTAGERQAYGIGPTRQVRHGESVLWRTRCL
jgi:hypothetical protein